MVCWMTGVYKKMYELKPYKCPVCDGRGRIEIGFYMNPNHIVGVPVLTEPCIPCKGSGILWGYGIVHTATPNVWPRFTPDITQFYCSA